MHTKNGFAAITIVLTLLVVSVLFSVTLIFSSIGEVQSSLSLYQGEVALSFVESCGEDALLRLRNDATFSPETITLPEGTCQLSFSGDESDQTLSVTGERDGFMRTIDIRVSRTETGLQLLSWLEPVLY